MAEVIQLWLGILVTSGTILSVLWKFCFAPLKKHFTHVRGLLSAIPQLTQDLSDIRKKVYPNGGSSLDDKLNQIVNTLHYQQQSNAVGLKLNPDPITKCNAKGEVIFVNFAWLALAGYSSPEEAYGTGWVRAVYPEDRERLKREWEDAVRSETTLMAYFRLQNIQTGKITTVKSHSNIIRNSQGAVVEYFTILTEQTNDKS